MSAPAARGSAAPGQPQRRHAGGRAVFSWRRASRAVIRGHLARTDRLPLAGQVVDHPVGSGRELLGTSRPRGFYKRSAARSTGRRPPWRRRRKPGRPRLHPSGFRTAEPHPCRYRAARHGRWRRARATRPIRSRRCGPIGVAPAVDRVQRPATPQLVSLESVRVVHATQRAHNRR